MSLKSSVKWFTSITDWKTNLIIYHLWLKNMRMNIWSRRRHFWRNYYLSVKGMYWKHLGFCLREVITLEKKDRPIHTKIASNLLAWIFTWYRSKYWFTLLFLCVLLDCFVFFSFLRSSLSWEYASMCGRYTQYIE